MDQLKIEYLFFLFYSVIMMQYDPAAHIYLFYYIYLYTHIHFHVPFVWFFVRLINPYFITVFLKNYSKIIIKQFLRTFFWNLLNKLGANLKIKFFLLKKCMPFAVLLSAVFVKLESFVSCNTKLFPLCFDIYFFY